MTRFATAARLAAWAGLAPGGNESASKRKKAPTRKGDADYYERRDQRNREYLVRYHQNALVSRSP
jgi:transposase